MSNLTQELNNICQAAVISGHPESLQVLLRNEKKVIFKNSFGKKYKYFDLASLTKILVTNQLVMMLVDKNELKLEKPVEEYLGFLKGCPAGKVTIARLLKHHSGLIWWRPYYEKLTKIPLGERASYLKDLVRKEKVKRQKHCVYSDVDYFILGWIVEELSCGPLDLLAQRHIFEPLKLKDTFFLRKVQKNAKLFAPTEINSWRKKVQGFVHDDNAWSLGGVAPHAGLFSTIDDVGVMVGEMIKTLNGHSEKLYSSKTLRRFIKRQVDRTQGDWALGFMLPSRENSTAGSLASLESFGHTGFTGTSIWIDPKKNLGAVVLSNRTYPSRDNIEFRKTRPIIHQHLWRIAHGK